VAIHEECLASPWGSRRGTSSEASGECERVVCPRRGGVSPIHIFDENLAAKMLRDILAEYCLFHLPEITGMPKGPWLSFRDGDPMYRSRLAQSLLTDAGAPDTGQPPSSPYLNVIETYGTFSVIAYRSATPQISQAWCVPSKKRGNNCRTNFLPTWLTASHTAWRP